MPFQTRRSSTWCLNFVADLLGWISLPHNPGGPPPPGGLLHASHQFSSTQNLRCRRGGSLRVTLKTPPPPTHACSVHLPNIPVSRRRTFPERSLAPERGGAGAARGEDSPLGGRYSHPSCRAQKHPFSHRVPHARHLALLVHQHRAPLDLVAGLGGPVRLDERPARTNGEHERSLAYLSTSDAHTLTIASRLTVQ